MSSPRVDEEHRRTIRAGERISAAIPRGGSRLVRHPVWEADRPAVAAALARSFLGRLEPAKIDRLLDAAVLVVAPAGAIVYGPSHRLRHVAIVVDGHTRAYATASDARQLTIVYGRAGSPASVSALAQGREAPVWIQALVPSTIVEIPAALVHEAAVADPSLGLALAAELQSLMIEAMAALGASVFGSFRGLLAWHLLQLAEPAGPDAAPRVTVAQADLATIVGSAREVVTRALRSFRAEHLVATSRSSIVILDPDGLAALAAGRSPSTGAAPHR